MNLDKIAMTLSIECQIDPLNLSVIGISGGPDSVCLLHILHELGCNLLAVHVNHQLRPEAAQEAKAVETFARGLGVEFMTCQVDVHGFAAEQSVSIEEAARTLRYKVLFDMAERHGAMAVMVAHNADDQVETILMHLLRGSGLVGLRGMEYRKLPNPWSELIALARPLISTWREEILEYLAAHNLSYSYDQSNLDTTFFRNRLRHELLPYLEKYNPRIRQNLLRMSQINKADFALLQTLVTQAWQANFIQQGSGYIAFNLTGFQKLPTAIQRYFLRKAIEYHLPGLRDIDFECIERGIHFLCDEHSRGQVDLMSGLRLIKEDEIFWLATWQSELAGMDYPTVSKDEVLTIPIPTNLHLANGWQLQAIQEPVPGQAIQKSYTNQDPFQAWLDLDGLVLPLTVHARKTGERFQPLGMQGHSQKISDLMVNLKLPRRARSTWPLVCSENNILWIPGFRQSHLGRIQPNSQRIVHLVLSRSSSA
jgi:tRNA(Ile)-lysidine synthase